MAIVLALLLVQRNDRFIDIHQDDLYTLACVVADSDAKEKEAVIAVLKTTFKRHLVDV